MAGDIHITDPTVIGEMLGEVERRFGVRLNPYRVAICRTVGDLYAHLLEVLGPDGGGMLWVASSTTAGNGAGAGAAGAAGAQDTPTLMALWRLRQGLHRLYPGAMIRADTVLDALDPDIRRPAGLARIADVTEMQMPPARLHPAWGVAMAVPGVALAWHFGTLPWMIVGGLLALLGFVFSDLITERLLVDRFARLPRSIRTVEDLARAAGLLNIGALRRDGGRIPERFLWAAYADCIRAALRVEGPVEPGQRFVLP